MQSELLCLSDFEAAARACMPPTAYEYIASAVADEITIRWNREAYDELKLRPRVLVDVEKIDMSCRLFGGTLAFPIVLAPTAFHRMFHPEGEVETARGAAIAGATFVVSSMTTCPFEDIAAVTSEPLWFQFYDLRKERHDLVRDWVQKLSALGCRAFCVTVDAPVCGPRNRQARSGFRFPPPEQLPYFLRQPQHPGANPDFPDIGSFTWDEVAWLRSITRLPILLKGIMNPDDAELAVRAGVDGIIVSNHAGRCLDTLPATISVLPEIADQVAGRIPVLVDGGIRRGTDVLKAIALGATAVLIGRSYLYGLAVGGRAGVARVVEILRDEFRMAMALTGCKSLEDIRPSVIWQHIR